MIRLPRTLRLDVSDTLVFDRAACPGEWAVPGGFCFAGDDLAALTGRRRAAFRAGFLGLGSFGWSTLVEVAEVTPGEHAVALAALAAHLIAAHGAPSAQAALAAAVEELAFAASLAGDHPSGAVLALARTAEGDGVRERFRVLTPRAGARVVFALLPESDADDRPEHPELTALRR